jgi:8-oxo-dGTP pyrophosphatase MutT (NUDIX family)
MHPAEKPDELLQCFDENGTPTQARPRFEVKREPFRWWHAVGCVYLVNNNGELMCSKRSEELSANPGKWQCFFGGHVSAGMTILETAIRELEEEAGVKATAEELFLVEARKNPEKLVFAERYAVLWNGEPSDLHFSDDEVTEAKWVDMAETWRLFQEKPDEWCNGCKPECQAIIKEWLSHQMQ